MKFSVSALMILSVIAVVIGASLAVVGFTFVKRLRQSLRKIHEQLALVHQDQNAYEITIRSEFARLRTELAGLKPALDMTSDPSEIIISPSDSYEKLDQNWESINDTSERRPSSTDIDGERGRTAVIVVLGQSNAGNHGSGRYVAKCRVDNFNIYDGKCYHAADPMLGASGSGGNFATRLGDKLIEAGLFDRIIIVPIAMGGTTVEQWSDEGMFNRRIVVLIRRLFDVGLSIDFILWQQGEGNPGLGDVGGRQYRKNLLEVVRTFRTYKVNAPFFVALCTFCGGPHNNAENIRAGQRGAIDPTEGIYLGADTDTIGVEYRWDGCHFAETGLDMAASMWCEVIADFQSKIATRTALPSQGAKHTKVITTSAAVMGPLVQRSLMKCLATAFVTESNYRPVVGSVILANERLAMASVPASEVVSLLGQPKVIPFNSAISEPADVVVAWEGLDHVFHPRAALNDLCGRIRPGGRLIYAQRLGGHCYLGLTPKWFLDYFIAARYTDCRIYLLWPPDEAPAVATFDYKWALKNARPVYNPMWDNITHAAALVVVAEKGAETQPSVPSQDIYRSSDEWKQYAQVLHRLAESRRPWHLTGPIPPILPQGFRVTA